MKVCLVVPNFFPHVGGGEQIFYDIAKGLIRRGHQVRVVSSGSGGVYGNVPYDGIDAYYYGWKMFNGHPVVRSGDLVEHIAWADIVHTTLFTTAAKTRKEACRLHKPCVITIYEVLGYKWFWIGIPFYKAAAFDLYERLACMQRFQGYHFISDATKKDYEKFCGRRRGAKRAYVCVHKIEKQEASGKARAAFQQYFKLKGDETCFLYYGRPAPNKGIFVLENAVRILKERGILDHIRFCWLLAGDPLPQRKELVRRVRKDGIGEYVKIMPSVGREKLFEIVSGADYVVIPSVTEGFGLCAAEACSLRKKVIYSSGGSLPEVVWGECLEFENRNADDLADKIQSVIEHGDAAFSWIPEKDFSEDEMMEGIMEMYREAGKRFRRAANR